MDLTPISNEDDYKRALAEIEQLFDAEPGTPEAEKLEVLAILVEAYENKNYPIPPPDPIEAIKYWMESRGKSRRDLHMLIPDLEEVRTFAAELHTAGQPWAGEAFGWHAEYHPERPDPPPDSRMSFSPADFTIGESGIWFFSIMWEHGRAAPPVEFLDDRSIVGEVGLP